MKRFEFIIHVPSWLIARWLWKRSACNITSKKASNLQKISIASSYLLVKGKLFTHLFGFSGLSKGEIYISQSSYNMSCLMAPCTQYGAMCKVQSDRIVQFN